MAGAFEFKGERRTGHERMIQADSIRSRWVVIVAVVVVFVSGGFGEFRSDKVDTETRKFNFQLAVVSHFS